MRILGILVVVLLLAACADNQLVDDGNGAVQPPPPPGIRPDIPRVDVPPGDPIGTEESTRFGELQVREGQGTQEATKVEMNRAVLRLTDDAGLTQLREGLEKAIFWTLIACGVLSLFAVLSQVLNTPPLTAPAVLAWGPGFILLSVLWARWFKIQEKNR